MPTGPLGRVAVVARCPVGLALVSWRYLWRTTPIHRTEEPGDAGDLPPSLPPECEDDRIQGAHDGVSDLLHRRYTVCIEGTRCTPEELLAALSARPNRSAPSEVAVFQKTSGRRGDPAVGDEFLIRMPGPWNGPVRMVELAPLRFRLATLTGHLEAGQIEFRADRDGGRLRFEIESWARPGDRLSHLLYNRLRLAKEIQLNLWLETCLRAARVAGGRARGGVTVRTRRLELPLTGLPGDPSG